MTIPVSEHKTLLQFLWDLLHDHRALAAFEHDPRAALHAAGLDGVTPADLRDAIPPVLDHLPPHIAAEWERIERHWGHHEWHHQPPPPPPPPHHDPHHHHHHGHHAPPPPPPHECHPGCGCDPRDHHRPPPPPDHHCHPGCGCGHHHDHNRWWEHDRWEHARWERWEHDQWRFHHGPWDEPRPDHDFEIGKVLQQLHLIATDFGHAPGGDVFTAPVLREALRPTDHATFDPHPSLPPAFHPGPHPHHPGFGPHPGPADFGTGQAPPPFPGAEGSTPPPHLGGQPPLNAPSPDGASQQSPIGPKIAAVTPGTGDHAPVPGATPPAFGQGDQSGAKPVPTTTPDPTTKVTTPVKPVVPQADTGSGSHPNTVQVHETSTPTSTTTPALHGNAIPASPGPDYHWDAQTHHWVHNLPH